jgi:hypothetical protein
MECAFKSVFELLSALLLAMHFHAMAKVFF